MAKEKSAAKEERRKEKKASKEKRSETGGVHKSKKDKKEKRIAATAEDVEVTTKLLNTLEKEKPGSVAVKEDDEVKITIKSAPIIGALVPFANPLADEKVGKKLLKSVKKSAKHKTLKRGVKEVVKAVRKSPTTSTGDTPHSIVVIAADISPMDVISHIPVLCEDHQVPYVFVTSRTELGAAGSTKRPTSVVMIGREKPAKKKEVEKGEDEEDWGEIYKDLVKVVAKASRDVKI